MNFSSNPKSQYISSSSLYKYPCGNSSFYIKKDSQSNRKQFNALSKRVSSLNSNRKPIQTPTENNDRLIYPSPPPSSQIPSFRFINRHLTSELHWLSNYNKIRNAYLSPKAISLESPKIPKVFIKYKSRSKASLNKKFLIPKRIID
jgi:hypothetical protein